jgi:ABC-type sugar transport system ATPase subunit
MAEIRLQQLTKRFGDTVVADALSLTIADGEFFTFLGPSGCGKSTLLHIIAGIEAPTSGTVWLGQRDVTALPPQQRDVAMVFQSYALYPHLSVFENLAFPLRNRRAAPEIIDREVRQVAQALGLTVHLDRRPGQLSGGQRQRVALGRALVRKPVAFLMDEPLSNLDAALRLELREEIKRIHQVHRITTVYVTHDQEEAVVLSDRVAVLRGGRVQQCAAPAEIYARPADVHVAQFVGMPPMNLLPAEVLAGHSALGERLAGGEPGELIVGLRPEDVQVHATGRADALVTEITLVEPTGAQTWVIGRLGDTRIKGRLARGEQIAPGSVGYFTFPVEALHLFDARSGQRIRSVDRNSSRAP